MIFKASYVYLMIWPLTLLITSPLSHNAYTPTQGLIFQILSLISFLILLFKTNFQIKTKATIIHFVFFLCATLSILIARDKFSAILLVTTYLGAWIQFRLLVIAFRDEHFKILFNRVVVGIGLILIFIASYQAVIFAPSLSLANKLKVFGTLGNSEFLAFFLLFTSVHLSKNKPYNLHFSIFHVLVAFAIALTRSRLALIAFLILWCARLQLHKKIRPIPLAGILGLATLGLAYIAPTLFSLHTIRGRILLWLSSIRLISENPIIGIGANQLENFFLQAQFNVLSEPIFKNFISNASWASRTHNELLDFQLEFGLLGSTCLIYLIFHLYRNINQNEKFMICLLVLISMASFPLHQISTIAILLPTLASVYITNEKEVRSTLNLWNIYGIGVLLGVSIWTCYFFSDLYLGKYIHSAQKQGSAKDFNLITISEKFYPNNYFIMLEKARFFIDHHPKETLRIIDRIKKNGDRVDSLKLEALAHFRLKNYEDSFKIYSYLHQMFPSQTTPLFMLGRIKFEQSKYNEAKIFLNSAIKLKPKTNKALFEQIKASEFLLQIKKSR